ncbi:ribosomal protein L7/L12 [Actinoplanes sp. NPDC051470]|uniref:ribosomal protein L7/L12 n=1 Tax=Actinoplanes sp. NPDC051470 TaxID=3157224 RepID=UPI0034461ECB
MEYIVVVAGVILAVGLAMLAAGSRGQDRRNTAIRLAAIERKLDLIMKHQGIVEPRIEAPDVVQELMQGRKIQAIKIYRERTGVGLAEAKNAVEQIARERGLDVR